MGKNRENIGTYFNECKGQNEGNRREKLGASKKGI